MKEIKTRHLILWGGTEYEVDAFMKMLRDEGDFEWFTGIEYSEAGMKEFEECFKWRHQNYTPGKRFFIFRKTNMIYVMLLIFLVYSTNTIVFLLWMFSQKAPKVNDQ